MKTDCIGRGYKNCRLHRLIRSSVLPGLAVLQVSLTGVAPAVALPPEPGTVKIDYLDPAIEAEWQRLREDVGSQEVSAPQETIRRYQQFYEQHGARSQVTAIKIKRLIAQLYWQKLNDREKALEIYDWAIKTYGDLPHMGILQTERDLVANTPSLQSLISVGPLSLREPQEETAVPVPLTVKAPALTPPALPQIQIPIGRQQGVFAAPLGIMHRLAAPASLPGAIPLPAEAMSNPFPMAPLVVTGIPQAPSLLTKLETPSAVNFEVTLLPSAILTANVNVPSPALPIAPRLMVLTGYITLWQEGRLSWEQVLKSANFTADDIVLITSRRSVVSMGNNGNALREKLGAFIRQSPELMERWEMLPVPAQVALAEDSKHRKDSLAVKIYQHLLSQAVPSDKELLTYRFAEYYAAMGDYEKAAQSNLDIAAFTNSPAWQNDSLVVAARYYRLAGKEEKALELYKRAENGTHAWATGISRFDQARILISQGKNQEAQRLLSLPLQGALVDQLQVALSSLRGISYYRTGDDALARQYSQDAIDRSKRIMNLLVNEGLGDVVASAQRTLQELDRWGEAPLLAQSASVILAIPTDYQSGNPFGFTLGVQSRYRVPLEVKCDLPSVRVRVVPPEKAVDHGHYFQTMIMAELDSNAVLQLKQEGERMQFDINVTSVKYPDLKLKIPVVITAGEAK